MKQRARMWERIRGDALEEALRVEAARVKDGLGPKDVEGSHRRADNKRHNLRFCKTDRQTRPEIPHCLLHTCLEQDPPCLSIVPCLLRKN